MNQYQNLSISLVKSQKNFFLDKYDKLKVDIDVSVYILTWDWNAYRVIHNDKLRFQCRKADDIGI